MSTASPQKIEATRNTVSDKANIFTDPNLSTKRPKIGSEMPVASEYAAITQEMFSIALNSATILGSEVATIEMSSAESNATRTKPA